MSLYVTFFCLDCGLVFSIAFGVFFLFNRKDACYLRPNALENVEKEMLYYRVDFKL